MTANAKLEIPHFFLRWPVKIKMATYTCITTSLELAYSRFPITVA